MLWPVHPWLAVAAALLAVVAVERIESAQLHPARQQVGRWTAAKSADVRTTEGKARQAQVDDLRNRNSHMVPRAAVVAGPGRRVAVCTRIRRTSENEGTNIRLQAEQALVGGSRIFQAEHIVDLAVVSLASFDAVHGVQGHGLVVAQEDCWLVHVIPEATDAHSYKIRIQTSPKLPRGLAGEVRKDAVAGPDFADVDGAVRIFYKIIMRHALVVRLVSG